MSVKRKIFHYFAITGLIIVSAIIFKTFILEIYIVPSFSMSPTLEANDYILVSKFSYRITTPEYLPFTNISIPHVSMDGLKSVKRGDVVLFKPPLFVKGKKLLRNVFYLKRCTGLPGDTIESARGNYFIKNGKILFTSKIIRYIFFTSQDFVLRIPMKGDTLLLTKNINPLLQDVILNDGHALELRTNGSIFIDGKESSMYVVNNNYYFMSGDNTETSIDSRNWGFLPEYHLIGQAFIIAWSVEGNNISWHKSIRWKRIGTIL